MADRCSCSCGTIIMGATWRPAVVEPDCPVHGQKTRYEEAALRHGAKLHEREDGMWVVLDQPKDSRLWTAMFDTRNAAAKTFCKQHGIEVPR